MQIEPLIAMQFEAIEALHIAQAEYDKAAEAYERASVDRSIAALEMPLFPGKDGARKAASNPEERKLAIKHNLTHSLRARKLRRELKAARRERDLWLYRVQAYRAALRAIAVDEGIGY